MFRNTMGNKIIEGFLNEKIKKFEKYVKNFKHVAHFSFIINKEKQKFEVSQAKVPVKNKSIN
jgi:hypothetical protein